MKRKTGALLIVLCLLAGLFAGMADAFRTGVGTVTAKAEETPITIDGDPYDWNYITPLFMAGGVINKLSAFRKDGTVYIKMEVSSTGNYDTWHLYFDTDGDKTNHLYFTGADYLIETDLLYKYEGDSGDWEGLIGIDGHVTRVLSDDKKVLELSIPESDFGDFQELSISAAVVFNWEDVAACPGAGEYFTIPMYEDVVSDNVTGLTDTEIQAYEASKEFKGNAAQWETVDYDAVFKNSNLRSLKAVTDGSSLYIGVSARKLSNNFTIYIDNLSVTGGKDCSDIWQEASDFDYIVKSNGCVYKMKGNSKADMGTAVKDFYKSDEGFEIKIPYEILGETCGNFLVALEDEGEMLPDRESSPLYVTSPIIGGMPQISVDGKADDWAGVEPIAHGAQTLGDLYAVRDDENLYVMTYIFGVTDPESSAAYTTSLFIDSDNDPETGFIHEGYPLRSGGNFLIQDWYSYGPDTNQEIFYTDSPVILPWNMTKQYAEGYKKVFAPTEQAGVYCAEWIVPIETMREVTEAVGDDFYICIDRDDCQTDEETYERLTPYGYTPANGEGAGFAKVPKYNITFDNQLKFDDFGFDDWNSVCNRAVHQNKDNLCAVRTDSRLYTIVTAKNGLNTDVTYYINTTDEGPAYDGFSHVDYVVREGKLYKAADNGELLHETQDLGNGRTADHNTVFMDYYTDNIVMQLYLSQIGNPGKMEIAVKASTNNGELLLPGSGMLSTSKVLVLEKDEGLFYPQENYAPYNNPFKGWVGWADICEGDIDEIAVDHNLLYVDIKWSEIEPEKGVYSFDAIEEQYQFAKWKNKGTRMVLRFVMDNPNLDASGNPDIKRMDIPEWLYNELEEENAEGEGAGTFYNGQTILDMLGGCGFSPNYKSPKLLEYHNNVVKALAERYDDPSVCAYVEVGSLGHWAEFHTWPTGTGEFPDPELAQKYMQPYADYFKNVKVGIRKPYELAANNDWGLYNDIFGVTSDGGTPTFLEWANTGNTDMPGSTDEDIRKSAMPEWWKKNFSGGEFANGDFRGNAKTSTIAEVLDQIRDSHTTWLGPCSGCDLKKGQQDIDLYLYNAQVMTDLMGYRYSVYSVSKYDKINKGEETPITLTINNSGVAPLYYDCPVTLFVRSCETGDVVYEKQLETDTREWLPGRTTVNTSVTLPSDLSPAEYTFFIKMETGDSMHQNIELAMDDKAEDGSCRLYSFSLEGKEDKKETLTEDTAASDGTVKDMNALTSDAETTDGTDVTDNETNQDSFLYILLFAGIAVIITVVIIVIVRKVQKRKQNV